ncbi:hypothetical protein BD309DRAFT_962409 [Dichomitus squalens]|nr:hypothetical protein BD309DRAFT_962409 [Dichomitus squalens]
MDPTALLQRSIGFVWTDLNKGTWDRSDNGSSPLQGFGVASDGASKFRIWYQSISLVHDVLASSGLDRGDNPGHVLPWREFLPRHQLVPACYDAGKYALTNFKQSAPGHPARKKGAAYRVVPRVWGLWHELGRYVHTDIVRMCAASLCSPA